MNIYSHFFALFRTSWIVRILVFVMVAVSSVIIFYSVSPDARVTAALRLCGIKSFQSQQIECVYKVIQQELLRGGVTSAISTFSVANTMYRNTLDVDCHAATHRVGDMAYYDLFKNDPDLSYYEFPPETTICGRGFYHGFFEHLIQDNPQPKFIVATCNYFKNAGPEYMKMISMTCFHAAGHGLIRANAEQVPRAGWGNPAPFVDTPLRICDSMVGVTEPERNRCKTGVMSIFIQMNAFENYGFSKKNAFEACDSLISSQQETCYRMASLIISQFEGDYKRAWSICSSAIPALQQACIMSIPVGLFTNGINPRSYQSALGFCSAVAVTNAEYARLCYEQLGRVFIGEYKDPLYTPDCTLFPSEYRNLCTSPKSETP